MTESEPVKHLSGKDLVKVANQLNATAAEVRKLSAKHGARYAQLVTLSSMLGGGLANLGLGRVELSHDLGPVFTNEAAHPTPAPSQGLLHDKSI